MSMVPSVVSNVMLSIRFMSFSLADRKPGYPVGTILLLSKNKALPEESATLQSQVLLNESDVTGEAHVLPIRVF